ncbi:GNAT family N-acetyltransferase [Streptomyces sp. NPDC050418]|uniref:GNAT family N-acetyltransferase n=1 Tax=Streptomyces sp. NPDC050418 TaxID=3365612 RepID=UPI00379123E9
MAPTPAHRLHERLAVEAGFRPVLLGEGRQFALHDLASLTEGALGEFVDPWSLTVTRERELRLRLGERGRESRHDEWFSTRYWLVDKGLSGRPVGTVAVDRHPSGGNALRISSLYVHPVARRRGLADAALNTVYGACLAEGLSGVRLDTHWTWQASVAYYLRRGLWVTSWKRALGLARLAYLPRYEVQEAGDELVFAVAGTDGAMVPMLAARTGGVGDGGPWLTMRETAQYADLQSEIPRGVMPLYARATLALHLAVRGWPLVPKELAGKELTWSGDIGGPASLAYMIGVFEKEARSNGWHAPGRLGRAVTHARDRFLD